MKIVEISDLTRSFGRVDVLRGINLTVGPGEHLALLGPSGSGKSTLLRIIAGLDHPDSGELKFDGISQLNKAPHERDVSMVFQQYALYPHLNVLNNISVGLRYGKGLKKLEAETRAKEVAAMVGIDHLLERKPKELSGGQRQRVALARAIARDSGTVLLDEPLSGLDAQLRLSIRTELFQRLRSTGATVIHVTHDQSDALAGSNRIAVINEGEIKQLGTPAELYETPADLFVATFLGVPQMNTFVGNAKELSSAFGQHKSSPQLEKLGDLGTDFTFGIRPEHLKISTSASVPASSWKLEATVSSTELNGPETIVYLTIGEQLITIRHQGVAPKLGETVQLVTDPKTIHLFFGTDSKRQGDARLLPLSK